MTKGELENLLLTECPHLYADMYGNPQETSMAWGVTIEPGWFDLVYQLSLKLERLILFEPEEERHLYKAAQVKQKFGLLRFYMTSSNEEMEMEIDKAETDSATTCETCGQPGRMIHDAWVYVACAEHANDNHKHLFKQSEKSK